MVYLKQLVINHFQSQFCPPCFSNSFLSVFSTINKYSDTYYYFPRLFQISCYPWGKFKLINVENMSVPRNAPPFPCIKATDKNLMFGGAYCENSLIFQQFEPLPVYLESKVVHRVEISRYFNTMNHFWLGDAYY